MSRERELAFAQQLQGELRRVFREQHDELFLRLDTWLAARFAPEGEAAARSHPLREQHTEHVSQRDACPDEEASSVDATSAEGLDSCFEMTSMRKLADEVGCASKTSLDVGKANMTKSYPSLGTAQRSGGLRLSNTLDLSKVGRPSWKTQVKAQVDTYAFELFFSIVIVVNSIFIGAEVQYRAMEATMEPLLLFAVVQNICVALFVIELVLRAIAEGGMFFKSEKWGWNVFDFILVVVGIFDILLDVATSAAAANTSTGLNLTNVRLIRIARIARLARLLRVARLVRFVRALSILLYSIASTFKSLIWATLLMVVVMYFFGILFTQATVEALHFCSDAASPECDGLGSEHKEELLTYWGDLPSAMYTLFKSVTGGIDWQDAVHPLEALSGPWVYLFIFFTGFADFALLNVVTGVFCQSAIESAQHDRELMSKELIQNKALYVNKIKDQFQDMFAVLDAGRNGEVTIDSFTKHLKDPTVQAYFALLELDAADAWSLFQLLDAEGTNLVDAEEFVDGCLRLKGAARSIDLAKLRQENKRLTHRVNELSSTLSQQLVEAVDAVANTGRADGWARSRQQVPRLEPLSQHVPRLEPLSPEDPLRRLFRDAALTNSMPTAGDNRKRKSDDSGDVPDGVGTQAMTAQTGRPSSNGAHARCMESPANSTSLGLSSTNTQDFGGLSAAGHASGGQRSPPQSASEAPLQNMVPPSRANVGTGPSPLAVRFMQQLVL